MVRFRASGKTSYNSEPLVYVHWHVTCPETTHRLSHSVTVVPSVLFPRRSKGGQSIPCGSGGANARICTRICTGFFIRNCTQIFTRVLILLALEFSFVIPYQFSIVFALDYSLEFSLVFAPKFSLVLALEFSLEFLFVIAHEFSLVSAL